MTVRALLTRTAVKALIGSTTLAALIVGALVAIVAVDLLRRSGVAEPVAAVLAVLFAVGPMEAADRLWSQAPARACNRLAYRLIRAR
ncbi:hypothetical protein ABZ697_30880 [Streptomyces albidoflavus]|uniref:hypothetical protein n=1 Tax=Streptomyces albidoflavus TaxID=1886 RepID=UPI0033C52040